MQTERLPPSSIYVFQRRLRPLQLFRLLPDPSTNLFRRRDDRPRPHRTHHPPQRLSTPSTPSSISYAYPRSKGLVPYLFVRGDHHHGCHHLHRHSRLVSKSLQGADMGRRLGGTYQGNAPRWIRHAHRRLARQHQRCKPPQAQLLDGRGVQPLHHRNSQVLRERQAEHQRPNQPCGQRAGCASREAEPGGAVRHVGAEALAGAVSGGSDDRRGHVPKGAICTGHDAACRLVVEGLRDEGYLRPMILGAGVCIYCIFG